MLVKREALEEAGGIESIRTALIDDCALAKRLKVVGPIWLGLSTGIRSIRVYRTFGSIRSMITRSAYAELRYSVWRLMAASLGMAAVFLAPPLLFLFAHGLASRLGLAAYGLMFVSFQPILRLYGLSPLWGLALPLIASAYMAWTVDSAIQYVSGRGGRWKGRIQAISRNAR